MTTRPVITPFSAESIGKLIAASAFTAPGDGTWVVNNEAVLFPFIVDASVTVKKVFWVNGTALAHADVGVYDDATNLLISAGDTAMTPVSVTQEVDVADTVLTPGRYWLAMSVSSTTGRVLATTASPAQARALGMYQISSALPLTTLPTFAAPATNNKKIPIFGILTGPVP